MVSAIIEELAFQGLDNLSELFSRLFNELMKAEREKVLEAAPYERTEARKGYANGFKDKKIQTRFGQLKLEVPQARGIAFYPQSLEKGERSERALKLAIAEMYVQGVSTRRIEPIAKELCGFELSSTQVSRVAKLLDEELEKFRNRPLSSIKYLYLDAHYEKVRHNGHVRDIAVLKAIGVNSEGYREILGVSCSLSEAEVHWRNFLEDLLRRGLKGIELIIRDDHAGLKAALRATLPSAPQQRCLFHLAQNAQSYSPTVAMREEIGQSIRDIFQSLNKQEAIQRMKEVIIRYEKIAPKFCRWLEENAEEGMTFLSYPREHWKKIKTTNSVERLKSEIRRRTRVARLFPNEESCCRLVTAICVEIHEDWMSGRCYIATK
jgi:transposase-like protein